MNEFMKVAMADAMASLPEDASKLKRRAVARKVMASHSAAFEALPRDKKANYDNKNKVVKKLKDQSNRTKIRRAEDNLREARREAAEKLTAAHPMTVAKFGWNPRDVNELGQIFSSDTRRALDLEASGSQLSDAPPLLSREERVELVACDDGFRRDKLPDIHAWVACMCQQREFFADAAIVYGDIVGGRMFVLAHASQSPYWFACYELRLHSAWDAASSGEAFKPMPRQDHFFNISVDHSRFVYDSEAVFASVPDVVLPFIVFERCGLAWSDASPIPFPEFVDSLPEKT